MRMLVIRSRVAILLGVGCESHDAVHALYKRRVSQAWPCPVTSHSVSSLLSKSIKSTIDLTLQIPHDYFSRELYLLTEDGDMRACIDTPG